MKSIKYIALTFLTVGVMSLQAMEHTAYSGANSNINEEYIKQRIALLQKKIPLSLSVAIQDGLVKLDPHAPDLIFNYITGKQITYGINTNTSYGPLDFQDSPSVKDVLPVGQYLHFSMNEIARDMLNNPYVKQWALTINSYQIIERILSSDEKKVAQKLFYHSGYLFYVSLNRIMFHALAGTDETLKNAVKEQAHLDGQNNKHIEEWAILGLDKWYKQKRTEQAIRLNAFLSIPYQDEEIEENKQDLFKFE